MLNEDEVDALIVDNTEESLQAQADGPAPGDAPPPPAPARTPEQLDKEVMSAAMKEAHELPFTPQALIEFSTRRFNERLPDFIKNTELEIRQHAAYGADFVELKTKAKGDRVDRYQKACIDHFVKVGFHVEQTEDGFFVFLSEAV